MKPVLTHGHGGYRRGCRCLDCREANNLKARLWHNHGTSAKARLGFLDDKPGIACRCGERITPCDGRWSEWKHVDGNREACADGEYALPAARAWRAVPCA